jgi:hypothetical protein
MTNDLMFLDEVLKLKKRAVHLGGRYFIDGPNVVRRFVTVVIEVDWGPDREDRDTRIDITRTAEPGKKFPQDNWILLEE